MATKRETVETMEYAKMLRRMIRAYAYRVAEADPEDLTEMLELRRAFDAAVRAAVRGQRKLQGRSWADIGAAAGITREAAYQKWGRL